MAEIPQVLKIQAEFTNEMLEQIRAVVREELNSYRDTSYWEKLTEEQKKAVNEWRSLTGQMLAARAAAFHREHPGLRIMFDFHSDVIIGENATFDISADTKETTSQ